MVHWLEIQNNYWWTFNFTQEILSVVNVLGTNHCDYHHHHNLRSPSAQLSLESSLYIHGGNWNAKTISSFSSPWHLTSIIQSPFQIVSIKYDNNTKFQSNLQILYLICSINPQIACNYNQICSKWINQSPFHVLNRMIK